MTKKQFLHATFYGFLVWLLPLLFSFLFYGQDGELAIDETLFKSIMIVVGALVGVPLFVKYFTPIKSHFMKHAFIVGVWWFVINVALDTLVLIPWMQLSFGDYFAQIGLRYLTMPIIALGFGYLLTKRGN